MTQANLLPPDFLATRWQQSPCFISRRLAGLQPSLSGDELAWLAMQEGVEARLVMTEDKNEGVTYRLQSGPFDESVLTALQEQNWTLLVQDVDKHLPAFRAHFAAFNCIPDWRIDDLMISVAAPGGSVGPHADNYDVFLLQGEGRREWRLGDASRAEPDDSISGLALLRPFDADITCEARCGDVLYLPPGIPHWGIAKDFCTTYSIGLRAPTRAELCTGAARVLGTDDSADAGDSAVFYTDSDLAADESEPGMIHPATIRRIRAQRLLDNELSDEELLTAFGCVVTDPKAWLMPEPPDSLPARLRVHGMARLAWHDNDGCRLAFANGVARRVSAESCRFVRLLCQERSTGRFVGRARARSMADDGLLEWLRLEGIFDAGAAPE